MSKFSVPNLTLGDEEIEQIVSPGACYPVPLVAVERLLRVRPFSNRTSVSTPGSSSASDFDFDFNWSETVNAWEGLKMANTSTGKRDKSGRFVLSKGALDGNHKIEHDTVRCRSLNNIGSDFFLAVVPESHADGPRAHGSRLDIALQAPLSFTNKLPGRISYRISEAPSADRGWDLNDLNTTILGSDVVAPLEAALVLFSRTHLRNRR